MYFGFNKSHMFVRLNLVANLMYLMYVNNTLPLALAAHEINTRHFWAAYDLIHLQQLAYKNTLKRLRVQEFKLACACKYCVSNN